MLSRSAPRVLRSSADSNAPRGAEEQLRGAQRNSKETYAPLRRSESRESACMATSGAETVWPWPCPSLFLL